MIYQWKEYAELKLVEVDWNCLKYIEVIWSCLKCKIMKIILNEIGRSWLGWNWKALKFFVSIGWNCLKWVEVGWSWLKYVAVDYSVKEWK